MYIVHFAFMNVIEYLFNIKLHLLVEHLNLKALLHLGTAIVLTYWVSGWTKRLVEDRFIQIGAAVAARVHLPVFFSQRRNGDSAM
jgi:peptidoglycan/LPS O-acetylase OafA/YrhL